MGADDIDLLQQERLASLVSYYIDFVVEDEGNHKTTYNFVLKTKHTIQYL